MNPIPTYYSTTVMSHSECIAPREAYQAYAGTRGIRMQVYK